MLVVLIIAEWSRRGQRFLLLSFPESELFSFALAIIWMLLLRLIKLRIFGGGICMVCVVGKDSDISLDVTSSPIRLERVSKEARLLWVNRLNIDVSFDIVVIWGWYLFIDLL